MTVDITNMIIDMDKTLAYYNTNAHRFTSDTLDVEFSDIQDSFLALLPPGSLILDFGCGSGRDSRYFLQKGFQVEACDGSEEMVKAASQNTGIPVKKMLFSELDETDRYDGIFDFVQIQLNYLDWIMQQGKEKYELLAKRGSYVVN